MTHRMTITFQEDNKPSKEEIEATLLAYTSVDVKAVTRGNPNEQDYDWTVVLHGTPCQPASVLPKAEQFELNRLLDPDRWFSVDAMYPHLNEVDVITRHCDEFTAAVALGYAKFLARCWNGLLDENQ